MLIVRMKCAALTLVILGFVASPQKAVAAEFSSFSGKPVESGDWSQLCVEKDGDYLVQGTDSDNPFVGCAKAREAAASARSCERQCSQATSDCIAEIGSNAGRSSACFDFAAACMSRCKGE